MIILIGIHLLLYERISANIKLPKVPDVPEKTANFNLHNIYILFINGSFLFITFGTVYHRIHFKYNHALLLCQYYD